MQQYKILIRKETESDYLKIRELVREAFIYATHSDGDEHNLISRIRQSEYYIPDLSLVAISDGITVGYIMFSRIFVGTREAIALAPLAVSCEMRLMGIGKMLVNSGHTIARQLGYACSVVLGYPDYYSKLGYVKASKYNVTPPLDIPDEYFMVCPLTSKHEDIPSGIVRYPEAFGI